MNTTQDKSLKHMLKQTLTQHYDVIIVGAGSGGSVLAHRLSALDNCKVLLIEAGPEQGSPTMLRATQNANQPAVVAELNWKIRSFIKTPPSLEDHSNSRKNASYFDYEAGRVIGGSSAVNATQALRGAPVDFEAWEKECGAEWGWSGVLPYFCRLEDDPLAHDAASVLQDGSALHGRGGPFPIRRETRSELRPLHEALIHACVQQGFPETHDHNHPDTTGVGVIPKNVINGIRMSTAQTYLAQAKQHPQLHILPHAHVHQVFWSNEHRVGGVEVRVDNQLQKLHADQVFICAGVMQTPGLLMRSGIGDVNVLQNLGIRPRTSLKGVGENLMEHPVIGIWGIPKAGQCELGEPLRQTLLRTSSQVSGYENDLHICMMSGINVAEMFPHLAASTSSQTLAGISTCFNYSTSRGYVRLRSADPYAPALVVNNCAAEAGDIAALKQGVRLAWRLLKEPALASKFESLLAWTDGMIDSDIALERAITSFVRPAAHGCGTARMGLNPEHGAVLTPQGRVHGVDNLWVADASAIPFIPSVPPHLTTLMVAEKIADHFCRTYTS